MSELFKRRTVFINKGFQTDFSIRFLILIVIEAAMAVGLFAYLSRGTVITGYSGSELVIARTSEYFLPAALLINLIVIGLTAVAGFIVMLYSSHKLAGPLYRFEKGLEDTASGDLTFRFNLRTKDQISAMADRLNSFNERMDGKISAIKDESTLLRDELEEIRRLCTGRADLTALLEKADCAIERLDRIERSAGYFKTSGSGRGL